MVNLHLAAAEVACEGGGTDGTHRIELSGPVTFEDVSRFYGRRFHRAVRMSEQCFLRLVEIVRPYMPTRGVPLECRVFMALRYYAGASYLDVSAVTRTSQTTFFDTVWDFTDATLSAPELQMEMPLWEADWRRRAAAGFQKRGNSPLNNIIGALDGIAIAQEQPSIADVACPKDHWCRKGFFALNVQAICDSNYEFLWMSCRTPGSSHDSAALACSDFGQFLNNSSLPLIQMLIAEGLCIAADEAYGDCELLAVPWPGGGGGNTWRDSYNFHQSSARIHIEQAFGQLVWRWGIFWRPLRMPFLKRPLVIKTAFLLHNLCRRHDAMPLSELGGRATASRTLVLGLNATGGEDSQPRRKRGKGSDLRDRMTASVESSGRLRPPVYRM